MTFSYGQFCSEWLTYPHFLHLFVLWPLRPQVWCSYEAESGKHFFEITGTGHWNQCTRVKTVFIYFQVWNVLWCPERKASFVFFYSQLQLWTTTNKPPLYKRSSFPFLSRSISEQKSEWCLTASTISRTAFNSFFSSGPGPTPDPLSSSWPPSSKSSASFAVSFELDCSAMKENKQHIVKKNICSHSV